MILINIHQFTQAKLSKGNTPAPHNCYICYRQRKLGFQCAICAKFTYYPKSQICGGLYDTGSCFCANCQGLIKKALKIRSIAADQKKNCACEFSLAGYAAGHSIHNYYATIQGLVKSFFKGRKLWIKLVCRSCGKIIQNFKLNCACYLKQKEHNINTARKDV